MPFLKYQSEIEKFNPCFIAFDEVDKKIAYRWVFRDINDPKNFSPVCINDPGRIPKDYTYWALSFHENKNQSKNSLLHFLKSKPESYKKIGTHIAEGVINRPDGLCERKSDEFGHFNHFEYEGVDFTNSFTIVEEIVKIA